MSLKALTEIQSQEKFHLIWIGIEMKPAEFGVKYFRPWEFIVGPFLSLLYLKVRRNNFIFSKVRLRQVEIVSKYAVKKIPRIPIKKLYPTTELGVLLLHIHLLGGHLSPHTSESKMSTHGQAQ